MVDRPTPYADLNDVLRELVASVQGALGDSFLGAYLQGSFAVGDFDSDSDVDFIVAIQDELSDTQVAALQAVHARVYDLDSEWAKHLEGSYFPAIVLRRSGQPTTLLWYLDHGSRSLVRSDHCNTTVVRWGQQILDGPEPYANRFYRGYLVLSYCRMLHDLVEGRPGSKREGAEWAKATLDPSWSPLIDRAWGGRPNPAVSVREPADPADFDSTLQFVRYVLAQDPLLLRT